MTLKNESTHVHHPQTFISGWYILGSIFLLVSLSTHFFSISNEYLPVFWVTTICLLSLLTGNLITFFKYPYKIKVSKTDILVFLYLCYGSIRWLLTRDIPHDPVIPCEWLGLTCIYILTRNLNNESFRYILLFILLAGGIQAAEGILQYAGLFPSLHDAFHATGSFYNPGPFGGYLAINITCGFQAWNEREFSFYYKKNILPGVLLALLVALILANSRAAWLAVIMCISIFSWKRLTFQQRYHPLFLVVIALIFITFILILYFYKKGSADMRVLTWNAGLLMFLDALSFGHGSGSFSSKYMLYQAEYLNSHPDGTFALIADNNILAFNEYLRLLCEQGIVGFILFSLIIFSVFKECHNMKKRIALGGLTCLGIFAFFSYPASILSIKIFAPLLLGVLGQKKIPIFEFIPSLKLLIPATTFLLIGLYFNFTTHFTYSKAFNDLDKSDFFQQSFSPEENTQYKYMLHDKTYLYRLGEQLIRSNQPEHALTVKKQLARIAPTSSLLCDIGILHLKKDVTDIADSLFTKAHQMTPNHITPVYCSFLVALQNNDTIRGQQLAEKIIHMPVRKINNIVLNARHKAKKYIDHK